MLARAAAAGRMILPGMILLVGPLWADHVFAADIDPALLAGIKARLIGPAGMSGRVAAIDVASNDPNTIYIGAATGGVWKSTNGGAHWTPIFDDQDVHAIGAIAVSPVNPDLIWVGTGEGNVRNSASVGRGVYRSLDGGRSWQHMGLAATERIPVSGYHMPFPSIGYVERLDGGGYRWLAHTYQLNLP